VTCSLTSCHPRFLHRFRHVIGTERIASDLHSRRELEEIKILQAKWLQNRAARVRVQKQYYGALLATVVYCLAVTIGRQIILDWEGVCVCFECAKAN
jgi:hypothetical protein